MRRPSDAPLVSTPVISAPLKSVPLNDTPLYEIPLNEMPLNEMPLNEMPLNEMPLNETPLSAVNAWFAVLVAGSGSAMQPANSIVGAIKIFRACLIVFLRRRPVERRRLRLPRPNHRRPTGRRGQT